VAGQGSGQYPHSPAAGVVEQSRGSNHTSSSVDPKRIGPDTEQSDAAVREAPSVDDSARSGNSLAGKKILIIVENLPVPFDRRVWQEARALRRHGATVSVICPTGPGCEERRTELDGIHIYRHPLPLEANSGIGYLLEYSAALFWEFVLAIRVIRDVGFDAMHICNPPDLIFLVALPYRWAGKKILFDHHDINPELYEAKFGKRGFYHRLLKFFEWATFRTCHVSVATNQSYRKIAIERGQMRPERVHVVRSGPSLERLKILSPDARWKNGRRFLIGYVGVIGQQEGVDHLLKALRALIDEYDRTDFHCMICGGGPALASIIELAGELDLNEYVTFTGRILDEPLLEILNTADICVNPDIWNKMNDKSTMNKVMEYMALSKPIVQYDLTEGRFSAGEASLYARRNDSHDFAAKIVELMDDEAKRHRMGLSGRRRVEQKLNWEVEEPKLIKAYEQLFKAESDSAS